MTRPPERSARSTSPSLPRLRQLEFAALLAAWAVVGSGSAEAIEIVDTKWGFDGTARHETFVPLHVLVRNDAPEQFTGQFVLHKHDALGNRIGAPLIEAAVLAPAQQNWIRFHVYLENGDVVDGSGQSTWNWRLRWSGNQRGGYRLETAPRRGPPARVLLLPRGDVAAGGSFGVPVLSDELFPASVTATDALGTVFLDHVPRWQDAQRRGFIDWLHRGGRVHVLRDSSGRYPRFPSSLGMLNQPDDATPPIPPRPHVGSGEIRFHPRGRFEIDSKFVAQVTARKVASSETAPNEAATPNLGGLSRSSDMSFFTRFKQMTTPDHNWLVIFALAGVYWLLLFPGGLVLGLKRIDYRIVLGSIVATIAIFSLGFSWIGARGYDEATVVNSLATARHLGGNRWDVQQWSALFVIDGDTYTISHTEPDSGSVPATGTQLYAVPGGMDRVPGSIFNGFNGRFQVAIAPYTLRPFLHRVASAGPQWNPEVIEWRIGRHRPEAITIRLSPSIGAPALRAAWVQYGTQILQLNTSPTGDGGFTLVPGPVAATTVDQLARPQDFNDDFGFAGSFLFGGPRKQSTEKLYDDLLGPLLSRTLRWIDPAETAAPLRTDRLRLFLVTDLPQTFHIKQPQRTGYAGRAIFVQDVVAPVRAETTESSPGVHSRPQLTQDAAVAGRERRKR